MSDIYEEPPDENETYESLDESLDDEDVHGVGPEGGRDIDSDMVVDETELEEAGAELDDPDRISMLEGGMDDPDGTGPPATVPGTEPDAGWDVDPTARPADTRAPTVGGPPAGAGHPGGETLAGEPVGGGPGGTESGTDVEPEDVALESDLAAEGEEVPDGEDETGRPGPSEPDQVDTDPATWQ